MHDIVISHFIYYFFITRQLRKVFIMTVLDLINQLKTLDPSLPVLIVDGLDKYKLQDYQVSAMSLHEDLETTVYTRYPNGEKKEYAVVG